MLRMARVIRRVVRIEAFGHKGESSHEPTSRRDGADRSSNLFHVQWRLSGVQSQQSSHAHEMRAFEPMASQR